MIKKTISILLLFFLLPISIYSYVWTWTNIETFVNSQWITKNKKFKKNYDTIWDDAYHFWSKKYKLTQWWWDVFVWKKWNKTKDDNNEDKVIVKDETSNIVTNPWWWSSWYRRWKWAKQKDELIENEESASDTKSTDLESIKSDDVRVVVSVDFNDKNEINNITWDGNQDLNTNPWVVIKQRADSKSKEFAKIINKKPLSNFVKNDLNKEKRINSDLVYIEKLKNGKGKNIEVKQENLDPIKDDDGLSDLVENSSWSSNDQDLLCKYIADDNSSFVKDISDKDVKSKILQVANITSGIQFKNKKENLDNNEVIKKDVQCNTEDSYYINYILLLLLFLIIYLNYKLYKEKIKNKKLWKK